MRILGIESSCDETAAAVVEDGRGVLSSVVRSQIDLHRAFGGVVPELACRAHIDAILPVIEAALQKAGTKPAELGAVAVTSTPGLVGALLVGVAAAKSLALGWGKPLVAVDHLEAHLYAIRMACPELEHPSVGMVVSGGHTSLYLSRSDTEHELLGSTNDDAAGEAFDKAAKILDLGFPGGPAIEKAARGRDPSRQKFKRSLLESETLDFSFSGIKTAVLYRVRGQNGRSTRVLSADEVGDMAAGFQEAVVDVLVEKGIRACERTGVRRIAVGGGVACNGRLRERMKEEAARRGIAAFFPPPAFCTDNAAMVAGIAWPLFQQGRLSDLTLDAVATKEHRR